MRFDAGHAFIPNVPGLLQDHLYIILTDPDPIGDAIAVNFTDARNTDDGAMVLEAGVTITSVHRLRKRSAINFAGAVCYPFRKLLIVLTSETNVKHFGVADSDLVNQMRKALVQSQFTPAHVKAVGRLLGCG